MKFITDHRKPSVLDRIRAHYLEGRKLSVKQELQRVKYEQAHSLRMNGLSREQTVRMLVSRKITTSLREAYRVVSSSEQLFGDVNAVHKDGLRHILTENLTRIYNLALAAGAWKDAVKANEVIGKINNLMDHDFQAPDWSKLLIPIPVYTSDPRVLKTQETTDIDFEDVDEE